MTDWKKDFKTSHVKVNRTPVNTALLNCVISKHPMLKLITIRLHVTALKKLFQNIPC